jgi:hypothetical protein
MQTLSGAQKIMQTVCGTQKNMQTVSGAQKNMQTVSGAQKNMQTVSGAQKASYSIGTGMILWRKNGRRVRLNTELHLVPRLRTGGAVLPLRHMPSWNAFYVIVQGS